MAEPKHDDWKNKRNHARAVLKTSVHLGSDSNFYTGFSNNISEGGIFIATHHNAPLGTQVHLEFSLPDNETPISALGEVRWCSQYNPNSDGAPGLGLSFLNLSDSDRRRIEAFVNHRDTLFYDD